MPAGAIPDRIVWAVERLALDPSDQVLEIGCSHGLAVPLVCEKLSRGRLMAIDRSPTMIAAAEKRNRAQMAAGKVEFESVALADAHLRRRRFSKIFAINVNLFWIDPSKELPVVRTLLRPDGALYLFYQPPTRAQLTPLSAKLARNLEVGGFDIDEVIAGSGRSANCLRVIARTAKSHA